MYLALQGFKITGKKGRQWSESQHETMNDFFRGKNGRK